MSQPNLASEPSPKEASYSSETMVSPCSSTMELASVPSMAASPTSVHQPLLASAMPEASAVDRACDVLALQVVQTERLLFELCGREKGLAALSRHRAAAQRRGDLTHLGHSHGAATEESGAASPAVPCQRAPVSTSTLPSAPTLQDEGAAAAIDNSRSPLGDSLTRHRSASSHLPSAPVAPTLLRLGSSSCTVSPPLPHAVAPDYAAAPSPLSPTVLYPGPPPRLTRPAIWNFSAQVLAWVLSPSGRRLAPKVRFAPQMSVSRVSLKWLRATSALEAGGGMVLSTLADRHPCRIRLEFWDDRRGGRPSEPVPGSVRSVVVEALLDTGLYDSLLILAHDFIDAQAGRLEEEESSVGGAGSRERRYFARFEALGDFRTEVRAESKAAKSKEKGSGLKRSGERVAVGGTAGAGNKRARE